LRLRLTSGWGSSTLISLPVLQKETDPQRPRSKAPLPRRNAAFASSRLSATRPLGRARRCGGVQ
jgi:hypothetical protein